MFYEKNGMLIHLTLNRPLDSLSENEKREFYESLDGFLDKSSKFVEELFDSKEE
jgi:hypothetical protein